MTERFSRIPFPVHEISASTPAELFTLLPGLKRYFNKIPEGTQDLREMPDHKMRCWAPRELVRIIKYIVILYDPETDLTFEYPDNYKQRKDAAAKIAGFDRKGNGEWEDCDDPQDHKYGYTVTDVMQLRNQQVIDWVIDYLKARKNIKWQEIVFLLEEIESLYRKRARAIRDDDVKADTMKIAKDRNAELQLLLKQFFDNHGELKNKAIEQMFPVSPENVFVEMKIPAEFYQLRQVRDVS